LSILSDCVTTEVIDENGKIKRNDGDQYDLMRCMSHPLPSEIIIGWNFIGNNWHEQGHLLENGHKDIQQLDVHVSD
jgi:hypothetical protein